MPWHIDWGRSNGSPHAFRTQGQSATSAVRSPRIPPGRCSHRRSPSQVACAGPSPRSRHVNDTNLHRCPPSHPRSMLRASHGSALSSGRGAKLMPSLTQTRQHGHGVVLYGHPIASGTKHTHRSEHCVLSVDNLSCQAVPILLVKPAVFLTERERRRYSTSLALLRPSWHENWR